jgi:hypothetical protein
MLLDYRATMSYVHYSVIRYLDLAAAHLVAIKLNTT